MKQADIIIVLGRGIEPDGTLPADPRRRIEKAVELFRAGRAPRLLMSGRWSFQLPSAPVRTEAAAMKEYAISLGVPAEQIVTEESSEDTVGNAYFVKKDFLVPHGWNNCIVVSSADHIERVTYVFSKILGPTYQVEFCESPLVLEGETLQAMREKERRSLVVTRELLESVTDGDDAAIETIIRTYHPAYADDPVSARAYTAKLFDAYDKTKSPTVE